MGSDLPALLVLADGRFPSGGHAHSGGAEAAVRSGGVHDVASLGAFLAGRVATVGVVEAALAAATVHRCAGRGDHARSAAHAPLLQRYEAVPWAALHAEAGARVPSPALRDASRRLGRQLVRAAGRVWPSPLLDDLAAAWPEGLHQPVALGAAAAAAALDPTATATGAAHLAVTGPASAALRLLGLDPFAVTRLVAGLGGAISAAADCAAAAACGPLAELPAASAPLIDLAADDHATWEVRLFAS